MALDKTDPNPGNNKYYTRLNSQTSPWGYLFTTYPNNIKNGKLEFPTLTDGSEHSWIADTSHAGTSLYAVLR